MLALVVDDDPIMRELAGRVLRRAGMGCLGFASADDALPALAELDDEVSVLVTDVQMPGSLDGLGLARHAGEAHPGLPVIVMSGAAEALEAAAALGAVVAVLEKPFALADLARLATEAARGT
jgi:DNA-binding NtrC family response regulator